MSLQYIESLWIAHFVTWPYNSRSISYQSKQLPYHQGWTDYHKTTKQVKSMPQKIISVKWNQDCLVFPKHKYTRLHTQAGPSSYTHHIHTQATSDSQPKTTSRAQILYRKFPHHRYLLTGVADVRWLVTASRYNFTVQSRMKRNQFLSSVVVNGWNMSHCNGVWLKIIVCIV